jgi:hypothetical protein
VLALLRRWRQSGVDESPIDSDAVIAALHALCHALEPRAALRLCLESARAVDAELESISPDPVRQSEAGPNHIRFNRGLHVTVIWKTSAG